MEDKKFSTSAYRNWTPTKSTKKLDEVFENLKCAAKVNLALGLVLQNVENNDYRYYYPHKNNFLLDRAHLLSKKKRFTQPSK